MQQTSKYNLKKKNRFKDIEAKLVVTFGEGKYRGKGLRDTNY